MIKLVDEIVNMKPKITHVSPGNAEDEFYRYGVCVEKVFMRSARHTEIEVQAMEKETKRQVIEAIYGDLKASLTEAINLIYGGRVDKGINTLSKLLDDLFAAQEGEE